MDLYRENILDHYHNPRNYGSLREASTRVEAYNDLCGDRLHLDLVVHDTRKKGDKHITNIAFEGEGCAISIASASMLTEFAKGKTVKELQRIDVDAMVSMLSIELTPVRMKCALLSWEVLQKGLKKF